MDLIDEFDQLSPIEKLDPYLILDVFERHLLLSGANLQSFLLKLAGEKVAAQS